MSLAKRRNPVTTASVENDSDARPSGIEDRSWNDVFRLALGQSGHRLVRQFKTPRVWLLAAAHAAIFAAAYCAAFWFRFYLAGSGIDFVTLDATLGWAVGIQLVVFGLLGQFHGWWRYVTFTDLVALLRAAAVSLIALASADYFFQ